LCLGIKAKVNLVEYFTEKWVVNRIFEGWNDTEMTKNKWKKSWSFHVFEIVNVVLLEGGL